MVKLFIACLSHVILALCVVIVFVGGIYLSSVDPDLIDPIVRHAMDMFADRSIVAVGIVLVIFATILYLGVWGVSAMYRVESLNSRIRVQERKIRATEGKLEKARGRALSLEFQLEDLKEGSGEGAAEDLQDPSGEISKEVV